MGLKLWEADCGDACGFIIWSHDKDEVAEHLLLHSRMVHKSAMTKPDATKAVRHAADVKAFKP